MHSGNWSDLADEYIFNQEFSSVSSSNKRERFKIDQNGDREMDFEFLTFGTWGFIIIFSKHIALMAPKSNITLKTCLSYYRVQKRANVPSVRFHYLFRNIFLNHNN